MFQPLFEHIDTYEAKLGVQSYGMSVTTLEEVFIKIAEGTNSNGEAEAGRLLIDQYGTKRASFGEGVVQDLGLVEDMEGGDRGKLAPVTDFGKIDDDAAMQFFWRHLSAMLTKRRLYFMRDTRSWIFQYVVPVLFVLVGMLVMRLGLGLALTLTLILTLAPALILVKT
jgi:ATP-binding cassette subfamily A (ABC1) protein 3